MASDICAHKDVRQIDDLRCCMSCGETLYLSQVSQNPGATALRDAPLGLHHAYSDLRLSHGNAIRLVVLFPGKTRDPLYCTIVTVDLSTVAYDTVSYTWATEDGDVSKTGRIHCPDGVVAITENCEAALRQLRLPNTPRQIWVDAICIDQSNTKERNHQVTMMGKIYQMASSVHICIQDPAHRYTECLRMLSGADLVHTATSIEPSEMVRSQTRELFRKRYFSRVWVIDIQVIQEVMLAKAVVLHVNSDSVTLTGKTQTALSVLTKRPRGDLYDVETTLNHVQVPLVLRNLQRRDLIQSVTECLRLSVNASSSDPRDMIFGVLSLLRLEYRDFIPVDYSQDYNHTFGLGTMLCIADCRNTKLLTYARLRENSDLANGCTFGIEEFRNFLNNEHDGANNSTSVGCPENSSFFRGKESYRPWYPFVDVKITSTSTRELQIVGGQHPGQTSTIEQTSNLFPPMQILPRLRVRAHLIDISCGTLRDQRLPKDILKGASSSSDAELSWHRRIFQTPHDKEVRIRPDDETSLSDIPDPTIPSSPNWDDISLCSSEINSRPLESTIFRTHYSIGYTEACQLPGDYIFAIDGAPWPFVSRQVDQETYRIVGHCYVWAARRLNYWTHGTFKGLWLGRPYDLGEGTRMIEIY